MTLQQTLEDLKPLLARYKPFVIFGQNDFFIGLRWECGDSDWPYVRVKYDRISFEWYGVCPKCGDEHEELSETLEVGSCYEVPRRWHEWMKDNDYLLDAQR